MDYEFKSAKSIEDAMIIASQPHRMSEGYEATMHLVCPRCNGLYHNLDSNTCTPSHCWALHQLSDHGEGK